MLVSACLIVETLTSHIRLIPCDSGMSAQSGYDVAGLWEILTENTIRQSLIVSYSDSTSALHVAQSMIHDIIASSRLGISNAWISRYSEANPPDVSPSYVFGDLNDLLNLLT